MLLIRVTLTIREVTPHKFAKEQERGIPMQNRHVEIIGILSVIFAFGSCSYSTPQGQKSNSKPANPHFTVAKLDGGPLTAYAPGINGLTKPVAGISLRRTFIILNDPGSPIEIRTFGFYTSDELLSSRPCPPAEQLTNPMDWNCAKLVYVLNWTLRAQASVVAWELHNSVFDVMNRFLWTNKSAYYAQGRDARGLEPGTEHKTDRVLWWTSGQTANLSKWVTSIVYVAAVRTKDGSGWRFDKDALRAQMKALSFEPADESN